MKILYSGGIYKEIFGVSPIDDLLKYRIECAELLLQYGGYSVSEIAEQVGFSSLYYFSRQFKKLQAIRQAAPFTAAMKKRLTNKLEIYLIYFKMTLRFSTFMIKYNQIKKRSASMANNSLTASYNELPLILRIILQVIGGVVVGGIYRIVRYFETRNIVTLVVGLLVTFTGVGNIISWILDLVTLVLNGRYTLFVD
jgi:hypothetical protein